MVRGNAHNLKELHASDPLEFIKCRRVPEVVKMTATLLIPHTVGCIWLVSVYIKGLCGVDRGHVV